MPKKRKKRVVSALFKALASGDLRAVADAAAASPTGLRPNSLAIACRFGQTAVVAWLLDQGVGEEAGSLSAAVAASCAHGQVACLAALEARGVVSLRDPTPPTVLHHACSSTHPQVVAFCLDRGAAAVAGVEHKGRTPMGDACHYNNLAAVALLIAAGVGTVDGAVGTLLAAPACSHTGAFFADALRHAVIVPPNLRAWARGAPLTGVSAASNAAAVGRASWFDRPAVFHKAAKALPHSMRRDRLGVLGLQAWLWRAYQGSVPDRSPPGGGLSTRLMKTLGLRRVCRTRGGGVCELVEPFGVAVVMFL